MNRKPRNPNYMIKAYYIEDDTQQVFWCKENKIRNISNEMGASMPMSNGERMIETDSPLAFNVNAFVKIGDEKLLIQSVNGIVDMSDLNAMRGQPDYIKTILIK
jgi:hypothetical protein